MVYGVNLHKSWNQMVSLICYPSNLIEMSKFNELINGDQPVLVDFHATWCGPCKTMAPVLEELKNEIGGKARVIKVDIDKNPAAARKYHVKGVPTFILFKGGQQVWRQSGAIPKSMLSEAIDRVN